jgi:hypothetical protein
MSDASKLVRVYIKIRDAKAAKQKELDDEIGNLDAQLSVIEQELLEICKATGQQGGKTPFGSFTRTTRTRYWTSDWGSMYKFIREHDTPEMLERRIHQQNFAEFLKEHPDRLPAGINVESRYSVTVRRAP